jgi:hypothetical protein
MFSPPRFPHLSHALLQRHRCAGIPIAYFILFLGCTLAPEFSLVQKCGSPIIFLTSPISRPAAVQKGQCFSRLSLHNSNHLLPYCLLPSTPSLCQQLLYGHPISILFCGSAANLCIISYCIFRVWLLMCASKASVQGTDCYFYLADQPFNSRSKGRSFSRPPSFHPHQRTPTALY